MLNFGGFQFLEVIFVQAGETYNLIKGIPVVTETQQGTWIENYKSLKIEEPYNRQAPSRDRPGQIDVIKVQNMQYEERSAEEIEAIKKRIRTEKNEIRV